MLDVKIAKECARFVLPLLTRMYMSVCSIMDSLHHFEVRQWHQKEHMDIAEQCKKIFVEQFPTCAASFRMGLNIFILNF